MTRTRQLLTCHLGDAANRWPAYCPVSLYEHTSPAGHARSRQRWLILFSLGVDSRHMSPIPSLPTDNLYKFCAVAGSVAIVASVLVAFQGWRDLLGQQFSIRNLGQEQAGREFDYKIADAVSKPWWRTDDERAHPEVEAAKTAAT